MSPKTQQRLNNWGCLLSLVMLIAGVVAAFLGRPAWLLPAVPIILISLLFWLSSESARRKAVRQRELEAFAEAFRGFDGPVPTLDSMPAMGWPAFTLNFDSKETLDLAEAQGRIAAFKAEIQKLYGHIGQGERFDVDRAVIATYEGRYNFDHLERQFPDLARRRAQLLARRSVTIWSQINYWAWVNVVIGTCLGALVIGFLGSEFTIEGLGIWNWPLAILYLASMFYMVTYMVFTHARAWVKYLWLFTVALLFLGLALGLALGTNRIEIKSYAETRSPLKSDYLIIFVTLVSALLGYWFCGHTFAVFKAGGPRGDGYESYQKATHPVRFACYVIVNACIGGFLLWVALWGTIQLWRMVVAS